MFTQPPSRTPRLTFCSFKGDTSLGQADSCAAWVSSLTILPVHITVDGTNVYQDVREDYQIERIESPGVILDLGAHIGAFALYAHELFPDALIVAVEPDPGNFAKLTENTADIKNIVICSAAVTYHRGVARFISGRDTGGVVASSGDVEVRAMTLDELMAPFEVISILKADIEGSEFLAFPACNLLDRVHYLALEVHLHARHEFRKDLWDQLNTIFELESEVRPVRDDMPGGFEIWRGFHR